jgi:hypothetical protein
MESDGNGHALTLGRPGKRGGLAFSYPLYIPQIRCVAIIVPDAEPLPAELAPVDVDPADREWAAENLDAAERAEYEAWLDHIERDYPREFPAHGYLSDRDIITATGGAG